ncbi:MAG TPA: hypothetical protein VLU73_00635 [Methylococcaceae bacterium]|nr:hypothetical protein [Methylococcaceae bacterium]
MKNEDTMAKALKDKINAKLQQAKAKLEGLEATAKERKAQAEIEAITALRAKRDNIQARVQEFTAAGEAKASQVKSDIETNVANFEAEVSRLAAKLKS